MISVRTPDRLSRVPNKPRTQHRSVRISDEDWGAFDEAAKAQGTDRASVIKEFIRWYLRTGKPLPERPTAQDWVSLWRAAEAEREAARSPRER